MFNCQLVAAPGDGSDLVAFIAELVAAARAGLVMVGDITPGGGKTWAGLVVAAVEALQGRTVVWAVATHELATEAVTTLERLMAEGLAPEVPVLHAQGALQFCRYYLNPLAQGDHATAKAVQRAFEAGGRMRGPCGLRYPESDKRRCPLTDSCEGAIAGVARAGTVTITVHAALATIEMEPSSCGCGATTKDDSDAVDRCGGCGGPLPPGALVFIDERPASVELTSVADAHLVSLYKGSSAGDPWRNRHLELQEFARALVELGRRLGREFAATSSDTGRAGRSFAVRRYGQDLANLLQSDSFLVDDAKTLIGTQAPAADSRKPGGGRDRKLPLPPPDLARLGRGRHWPDASATRLCYDLADLAVANAPAAPGLELRLDPDGSATWERRTIAHLPADVAVVVLDGTASRAMDLVAQAKLHGLEVDNRRLDVDGAAPLLAVHSQTGALQAGELWDENGQFSRAAAGAYRNAIMSGLGELRGTGVPEPTPGDGGRVRIGVLTHKKGADALRWGIVLAADDNAAPPPGAAFDPTDPGARGVAMIAADLTARGWDFEIGHFFADDRGTNRFADVRLLLVLGFPLADVGAAAADARALGIEEALAKDLPRARATETLIQSLARARHGRVERLGGPPGLFYAGASDPPLGAELPRVEWQSRKSVVGKHAPTIEAHRAEADVALHAEEHGGLAMAGLAPTLEAYDLGPTAIGGLMRRVARARGWKPHDVVPPGQPRRWVVWAENQVRAEGYARRLPARKPPESLSIFDHPDHACARERAGIVIGMSENTQESQALARGGLAQSPHGAGPRGGVEDVIGAGADSARESRDPSPVEARTDLPVEGGSRHGASGDGDTSATFDRAPESGEVGLPGAHSAVDHLKRLIDMVRGAFGPDVEVTVRRRA